MMTRNNTGGRPSDVRPRFPALGVKALTKVVIWSATGLAFALSAFVFDGARAKTETVPFPDGYLLRERPSIFFDGHRDNLTDAFLYDLVIEDIVEFIVVRVWVKQGPSDRDDARPRYSKLTRTDSRAECLAADRLRQRHVLSTVWRSNFDLVRGRCVIAQPVNENDSDLAMLEDEDFWSVELRSSGRQIARAPKAYRHKEVRALFGERATISIQPGSPVFTDEFKDEELIRAIESGGRATAAAITIIRLRARIDDSGLVPEISVRRTISPAVLERMLALVSLRKDDVTLSLPGFLELIPGASPETAEIIFSKMIEMLYAPFKTSKPHGPWYYGNRWKEQIRDRRPGLEDDFADSDHVPVFASAAAFRSASALALHLGEPYTGLFYEEFRTEIVNRVLSNSGPSFYTAILAHSEPDLVSIVSAVGAQKPSPNRTATLWALIEQGRNLPKAFIEALREGCGGDLEFLNDAHASRRYLDGDSFCAHFFQSGGARFRK